MKVLAIRGCNIASLEGDFEIDFTSQPLSEAGIFVITGPTGAGKSTILDVLTVALYNDIPRFKDRKNIITDHDVASPNYNSVCSLLRRGTGVGFAEVDFIGNDGDLYRSRVNIRRARNKADAPFQKLERRLYNLSKDTEEGGTSTELLRKTEIKIGLSLDQFVRSILLPQGEFSFFLKSNDDERAEILEKLTGTDIYSEISKKVYQKAKEISIECNNLRIRMSDIKLLTEEESRSVENDISVIKIDIARNKEIIKEIGKLYNLLNANKESLETNILCKKNVDKTNEIVESLKEDKRILDMIDEFSDLIREFRIIEQYKDELSNIYENKQSVDKEILDINNIYIDRENEYNISENNLNLFLKEEPDFIINLKNIRSYENQITILQNNIEEIHKSMKSIEKQLSVKTFSLLSIVEKITKDKKDKDEYNNFITKNFARKKVVENFKVIITTLENCKKYKVNIANLSKSIDNNRLNIADLEKKNQNIINEISENNKLYLENLESKKVLEKNLSKNDITLLRSELEIKRRQAVDLTSLIYLKSELTKILSDKIYIEKTLNNDKIQLDKSQMILQEYNSKIIILKAKLEQQKESIEDLTIASGKDVELLRSNLRREKECPVCGSLNHPYSEYEDNRFNNALEKVKEKYLKIEEEYNLHNNVIIRTLSDIEQIKHRIEDNNKINSNLDVDYKKTCEKVALIELSKNINIISEEVNEDFLKKYLYDNNLEIQKISELLLLHDKQKQEFDFIKEKIIHCEKRDSELKYKKSIYENNIVSLKRENQISEINLDENNSFLNKELLCVDNDFSNSDWQKNWIADSESFIEKLKTFVAEWENAQNKITDLNHEILKNEALCKLENEAVINLKKEINEKTDIYECENKNLLKHKEELLKISDGQTSELIEDNLKKKRTNLENIRNENLKEFNKIKIQKSTFEGRSKEINQIIENRKQDISQKEENLNKLIAENNKITKTIDIDVIRNISAITSDRQNNIRSTFNQANENHIKAEKDYEISCNNLDENIKNYHKQCDVLLDNLTDDYYNMIGYNIHELINENNLSYLIDFENKILNIIENKEAELNEKNTIIRIYIENKKNHSSLIKQLHDKEIIYSRWSQLNEVIGQADGKKFKKIAQEYTLDMLLMYANIQIANIAPRYGLKRIENTLALQVVDKDMCDQLRSVHSLSGGETFLVSLALALALSSISSRNIKIESLFIDEGFGTLDAKTLHTVMDALEELYLQGRKVGIITHVKELTENIPVRVLVDKQRNGASYIKIEG